MVRLPRPVTGVADAYLALKPQAVLDAEAQGKTVLRQGEWFFIPCDQDPEIFQPSTERDRLLLLVAGQRLWGDNLPEEEKKLVDEARAMRAAIPAQGRLQAGRNRPNTVEKFLERNGRFYVKGEVEHTGREHKTLELSGWHEAIANTAQESWTVTGDID